MSDVIRQTVTFLGHTPPLDREAASALLRHLEGHDFPGAFSNYSGPLEEQSDGGAEGSDGTADHRVTVADHEPETVDILDADATVFTAHYDADEGHVAVEFRCSDETLDVCLAAVEHLLAETTLHTGDPSASNYVLDVQFVVDGHYEPFNFSPPEGMLFRTKRTRDGRTALRLLPRDSLLLEGTGPVREEIDRASGIVDHL